MPNAWMLTGIAVGGAEIVVSDHIKILGVHLDSTLSMKEQVTAVAKACNFGFLVPSRY